MQFQIVWNILPWISVACRKTLRLCCVACRLCLRCCGVASWEVTRQSVVGGRGRSAFSGVELLAGTTLAEAALSTSAGSSPPPTACQWPLLLSHVLFSLYVCRIATAVINISVSTSTKHVDVNIMWRCFIRWSWSIERTLWSTTDRRLCRFPVVICNRSNDGASDLCLHGHVLAVFMPNELLLFVILLYFFTTPSVKIPRVKNKVKSKTKSWSSHSSSLEKLLCFVSRS